MARFEAILCQADDVEEAWPLLEGWGFGYDPADYSDLVMFCVFDKRLQEKAAYFWFEFACEDMAALHMCASPVYQSRWYTRHIDRVIKGLARLLGLSQIFALVADDTDIARYVTKLGWSKREDFGYFLDLE